MKKHSIWNLFIKKKDALQERALSDKHCNQIIVYMDLLEKFGLFDRKDQDDEYFFKLLEKVDFVDEELDIDLGAFILGFEDAKAHLNGIFCFPQKADFPLFLYEEILNDLSKTTKIDLQISEIHIDTEPEEIIHFKANGVAQALRYKPDTSFSLKYTDIKPMVELASLVEDINPEFALYGLFDDQYVYIMCLEKDKLEDFNKALEIDGEGFCAAHHWI